MSEFSVRRLLFFFLHFEKTWAPEPLDELCSTMTTSHQCLGHCFWSHVWWTCFDRADNKNIVPVPVIAGSIPPPTAQVTDFLLVFDCVCGKQPLFSRKELVLAPYPVCSGSTTSPLPLIHVAKTIESELSLMNRTYVELLKIGECILLWVTLRMSVQLYLI